jgi:hypothetical protein
MKYMLLIYSDPTTFDPADGEALMGEYMKFTMDIVNSGEFVAGDPLGGAETATTVRVRDGKRGTTDGPFAETKEVLGGYYVVDVKDLDRALEIAALIPDARRGSIEVRPVMDIPG